MREHIARTHLMSLNSARLVFLCPSINHLQLLFLHVLPSVREARMVPETNENAFGFNLSLSTSTGSAEIMSRLKEAITHVFKALQDKSNNLEVELLELKQKLEEWEDRLKISHQEVRIFRSEE